jgi:hypothetical protein
MKPEFNRLLAHREAMRLARKGDQQRGLGNLIVAKQLYLDALSLEKQAAMTFLEETGNEPTRSVIFRSAASLAYLAQEYREAEKLIAIAIAGDTPPLILEQLRDLLESVNFERHLQLRGIVLSPNEFQMSIAGNGIGLGIAPSAEVFGRQRIVEQLTIRTAERLKGMPFRESGSPSKELKSLFTTFHSVSRAASFAMTFRVGANTDIQSELFGENFVSDTIDEMLSSVNAVFNGKNEEIEQRIPNISYRRNLLGLAKELAPDGDRVKLVGFTVLRNNEERTFPLSKTQDEIKGSIAVLPEPESVNGEEDGIQELTGILKMADETQKTGKIKLVGASKSYKISVPEGLGDVVKLHWGEEVSVQVALNKKNNYRLLQIEGKS